VTNQDRITAAQALLRVSEQFEQMDDFHVGPYDDIFIELVSVASNLVTPDDDRDRRTRLRERTAGELTAIADDLRSNGEFYDAAGEEG
jgi:hypothetical protein